MNLRNCRLGIIGLGYVGLPLAVEFGKHFETVGFDVKASRIAELKAGRDSTLEVTKAELKSRQRLSFTTILADLQTLSRLHRHGADSDRRVQAAGSDAAGAGQRERRQAF